MDKCDCMNERAWIDFTHSEADRIAEHLVDQAMGAGMCMAGFQYFLSHLIGQAVCKYMEVEMPARMPECIREGHSKAIQQAHVVN